MKHSNEPATSLAPLLFTQTHTSDYFEQQIAIQCSSLRPTSPCFSSWLLLLPLPPLTPSRTLLLHSISQYLLIDFSMMFTAHLMCAPLVLMPTILFTSCFDVLA